MGCSEHRGAQGFRTLSQNKQGSPRQSHSKGLWDGFWPRPWERQQRLGSLGWCAPAFPSSPPPLMDQSQEAAIVSLAAQSCVLFRHYFWRPEEKEKKAKKGVAVLGGTFARKGFQGLLGQRRQSLWIKRS